MYYTAIAYQKLLKDLNIIQSISRRGNCWDKAYQEPFFGHMKDELHLMECLNFRKLKQEIDDYMDYYNNYRYQWDLNKIAKFEYIIYLLKGDNLYLIK